MADIEMHNHYKEKGFINASLSNTNPAQEVLWDRVVLIVATLLLIMGFTLPVLAQLPQ